MSEIRDAFSAAMRLHQSGRLGEAERLYRQILQTDPRHCDALHFLGVIAHQLGRHDAAIELMQKSIAENGRVPSFHNNLGNALKARGRLEDAAASFGRALSCNPDYAEAHFNLGTTLLDLGRVGEAADSFRQAVAARPNHPDALCNLGGALILQGRYEEAAAALEQALSFRRDHGKSLCSLGIVRLRLMRLDDAIAYCRRAIVAEPTLANAYLILGNGLGESGRQGEALAAYGHALKVDPALPEARLGLAMAAIPLAPQTAAESHQALARFLEALDALDLRIGKAVGSSQPFHLAYRPGDISEPLFRYGEIACTAAAAHWGTGPLPITRRPESKIRLGIVSGQIKAHPVWDVLLRGIVEHLDRDRFDLILYHTGQSTDAETAWAKGRAMRFVQGPMPVRNWLEEIRRDRPDILFYPEIGMDPTTCTLAALRLAPVQAASWGHPVTTGLPSIDLYFSGDLLEGPDSDQHYREKLIRLPGTGACTEIVPVLPAPWSGGGRSDAVVRFALCQQPIKFDPSHDHVLAQIAKGAGPCEFWLPASKTHPWATEKLLARLAQAFRNEGLDPEAHLRTFPWLGREGFAGFLDAMDIYLDCPAFSGYTTAWAAIHRGLPVVTLEGEFLRQRLAAGLLRQIGQTEGVAQSLDTYVETTTRWAGEDREPRRRSLAEAAPQADGNRAAVAAFAETLIAALA